MSTGFNDAGSGLGRGLGIECLGSVILEKGLGSLVGLRAPLQAEVDLLEESLTLLFLAPSISSSPENSIESTFKMLPDATHFSQPVFLPP